MFASCKCINFKYYYILDYDFANRCLLTIIYDYTNHVIYIIKTPWALFHTGMYRLLVKVVLFPPPPLKRFVEYSLFLICSLFSSYNDPCLIITHIIIAWVGSCKLGQLELIYSNYDLYRGQLLLVQVLVSLLDWQLWIFDCVLWVVLVLFEISSTNDEHKAWMVNHSLNCFHYLCERILLYRQNCQLLGYFTRQWLQTRLNLLLSLTQQ